MQRCLPLRGLYAITDGPRTDLIEAVTAAMRGGAVIVQYRDKSHDPTRRLSEAHALRMLTQQHRVPLIINDDIELARSVGADGVHLGENDADIAHARTRLGATAIVGISCYDDMTRAQRAAAAGANYLAFGAFFPSPTKPHARRATTQLLREAKSFGLPLVAIGGIRPDNTPSLLDAGADFVAVVSGIFGSMDIACAAGAYATLFIAHGRNARAKSTDS